MKNDTIQYSPNQIGLTSRGIRPGHNNDSKFKFTTQIQSVDGVNPVCALA